MRLTYLDVPDWLSPALPRPVTQTLFAVICCAAAIGVRFLADLWSPGAGPFALTVPAVLVATLFGRWLAGVITQSLSSLYAWYFVLPIQGSFAFSFDSDAPRVVANMAAGFFVVALAEMFRRTMRHALLERETLLREVEHRVKNNFASIAAVLRLQLRECQNEDARHVLQAALGRVESFARAHTFLYQDFDHSGTINMRTYLTELCHTLAAVGDDNSIVFDCDSISAYVPRDRAIAMGLLVNEVTTNSIKHAFVDRKPGRIQVVFAVEGSAYRLVVSDDGRGIVNEPRPSSLGMSLIEALTKQANGTLEVTTGAEGTTFSFRFAR